MLPEVEPWMDRYMPVGTDVSAARDLLSSDMSSRRDIRAAVLAVLSDVRAHFTIEESRNGSLATVSRDYPEAAEKISAFRHEHEQLLAATTHLEQLLERELDGPTWRAEVLHELSELVQAFQEHERHENAWIAHHIHPE